LIELRGCYSPSHEWQDHVAAVLRNRGSEPNFSTILNERKASGGYNLNAPSSTLSSSDRRQRRKLSGEGLSTDLSTYDLSYVRDDRRRSASTPSTLSDEDDVMDAVGQLSLNEDEEVRYHGKASGLHLLGGKERDDSRNEGGIWLVSSFFKALKQDFITSNIRRFPPARVWPPLPNEKRSNDYLNGTESEEHLSKLPNLETQDHLLELYFIYVHPSLPVVHKKAFFDIFKQG
jgi:hypothetical protein